MVKKNQGLLMYGNVGTGKTFAAACIANYLLDRKVPTVMTSFVKIVDSADLKNRETANAFISRLNRARLLIIDDLGPSGARIMLWNVSMTSSTADTAHGSP